MKNLNVFSSEKSVTQHLLKQYSVDSSLTQMTIGMIRLWLDSYPWFSRPTQLWLDSFESESSQIWLTTHESSTTLMHRVYDSRIFTISIQFFMFSVPAHHRGLHPNAHLRGIFTHPHYYLPKPESQRDSQGGDRTPWTTRFYSLLEISLKSHLQG